MSKQIESPNGTPDGMQTPKKTPPRGAKKETIPPLKGFHRAIPILLFALAIFIGLCFFMENTGTFGRAVRTTLYGLFSFGAYLIPFMLILHAIFYASDTYKRRKLSRLLFTVLTLIFFCACVYCIEFFGKEVEFLPKEYYARGKELKGGGLVGSVVAYAITKVFGSVGLIIIALMVVALYITFFFSRESNVLIRFLLKALTAIFTFFSKIEKGLKSIFSPEERAKRKKAKATVQKQRELMEDDFFDVDDGLERLEIPALGITQMRDSRSQEENPMLHDRVIHDDGMGQPDLCGTGSALEDVVSAQEYDAFVIDDIPRGFHATEGESARIYTAQSTHTPKEPPYQASEAPFSTTQATSAGAYGATSQAGAYGATSQTGAYGATSQTGAYGATSQTGSYGTTSQAGATASATREMNAEEAFGADFDAFDVRRNQEILQRNARASVQGTSPLHETIESITPEEVERLRREQEFERRKASILSQREAEQSPHPHTAAPSAQETPAFATPSVTSTGESAYTGGATRTSEGAYTGGTTRTSESAYTGGAARTSESAYTGGAARTSEGAYTGGATRTSEGAYTGASSSARAHTESAAPEAEFLTPESYAHIAEIVREAENVRPVDAQAQRGKVSTFTFGEQPKSAPLSSQGESFVLTIDKTPKTAPEEPKELPKEPVSTVYQEGESTIFIRGDKRKAPEELTPTEEDPFRQIAERIARGEVGAEATARVDDVPFTSVQRTPKEGMSPSAEASAMPKATATSGVQESRPQSEEASLIGAVLREFETEQGLGATGSAQGPLFPEGWTAGGYYEQTAHGSLEVTREIIEEPVYEEEEESPLDFIDEEERDEEEAVTDSPEEDVTATYIPPEEQNPAILEQRNLFAFLRGTDPNSDPLPEGAAPLQAEPQTTREGEPASSAPTESFEEEVGEDAPPFDGATRSNSRFAEYISSMSRPEERAKPTEEPKAKPVIDYSDYKFPPIDLLKAAPPSDDADAQMEINASAEKLIDTLASFRVQATVKGYDRGPRITRYEVVPARGVKVSAITNLFDDISLALAADGVRMEAPIPGKSAIGFEIPNKKPSNVYLRDLIESDEFMHSDSKTIVCMGKDVAGTPIYGDIAKMPHVLVAGATGMGKSVCINAMMLSILFRARPDEVKLIMIDPKKVEFQPYNGIPHLLVPVVIDPKQAAGALMWAVEEMEKRFDLIEQLRVKKIDDYNEKVRANPELGTPMPKIIIVIDELNDLMIQVRDPVENLIMRIAQKARAAGIHLIIGTQRPSVNVITGVIKANIPSRISCKVASTVDSRTILETAGAEKLLDRGDMLFFPVTRQKPLRVQGAYVSDTEVDSILDFLREQAHGEVGYDEDVLEQINRAASKCSKSKGGDRDGDDDDDDSVGEGFLNDPTFLDAVKVALHAGKISTSLLQRKLSLGFGRAAKYIDIMEDLGVVGEKNGQKPRDVLISMQDWEELLSRRSLD